MYMGIYRLYFMCLYINRDKVTNAIVDFIKKNCYTLKEVPLSSMYCFNVIKLIKLTITIIPCAHYRSIQISSD